MTFKNTQILIVVDCNIAKSVNLISKKLHLALICFNVVFKHLLRPKINFKVVAVFLEFLDKFRSLTSWRTPTYVAKGSLGFLSNAKVSHKVFVPATISY